MLEDRTADRRSIPSHSAFSPRRRGEGGAKRRMRGFAVSPIARSLRVCPALAGSTLDRGREAPHPPLHPEPVEGRAPSPRLRVWRGRISGEPLTPLSSRAKRGIYDL